MSQDRITDQERQDWDERIDRAQREVTEAWKQPLASTNRRDDHRPTLDAGTIEDEWRRPLASSNRSDQGTAVPTTGGRDERRQDDDGRWPVSLDPQRDTGSHHRTDTEERIARARHAATQEWRQPLAKSTRTDGAEPERGVMRYTDPEPLR